jgi:transcription initiation factor TFIID subunit 7
MEGKKYPCLLLDLPCIVETHKTQDYKSVYKSGDVGQMILVYEPGTNVKDSVNKLFDEENNLASGLTPPTFEIVKRRYNRRKAKQQVCYYFVCFDVKYFVLQLINMYVFINFITILQGN